MVNRNRAFTVALVCFLFVPTNTMVMADTPDLDVINTFETKDSVTSIYDTWLQKNNVTGIEGLHALGYNGNNVTIGVIDNGVDQLQPDLEHTPILELDLSADTGTETHGTPVVGVMIGSGSINGSGTAPNATIRSVRMWSDSGDRQIYGNFTKAIDWLIQEEVDIINLSFGGIGDWQKLLQPALDHGIIIVASAGNDGTQQPVSGPGSVPSAISVGWVDSDLSADPASSVGPSIDFFSKPDVVAFGSLESLNVISGVGMYHGTSFSSPYVAGGIASVMSRLRVEAIPYDAASIKAALKASATDLGLPHTVQGAGLVNFTRMYELLRDNQVQLYVDQAFDQPEYMQAPAGVDVDLPLQLTSNVADANVTISSGLQPVLTSFSSTGTTRSFLHMSTKLGVYSGTITVEANGTMATIPLSFNFTQPLKGRILYDFYYTDVYISGTRNLLSPFQPALRQLRSIGYWIDGNLAEINASSLDHVDMIIFENPFSLDPSLEIPVFSTTTINALHGFVSNGGRILLSHQSLFDGKTYSGSDVDAINAFTEAYGLSVEYYDGSFPPMQVVAKNTTSMGSIAFAYQGGTIIGGRSLLEDSYPRGMVYADDGAGRLLVASSTIFMSDPSLSLLVDWLMQPTHELSCSYDNTSITISLQNTTDITAPRITVQQYSFSNHLVNVYNQTMQVTGSMYNLSLPAIEGLYDVECTIGKFQLRDSYMIDKGLIVDLSPPTMKLPENISIVANGSLYYYQFIISENNKINTIDVIADSGKYVTHTFNETNGILSMAIYQYLFDGSGNHTIEVTLSDASGLVSRYVIPVYVIPLPDTSSSQLSNTTTASRLTTSLISNSSLPDVPQSFDPTMPIIIGCLAISSLVLWFIGKKQQMSKSIIVKRKG